MIDRELDNEYEANASDSQHFPKTCFLCNCYTSFHLESGNLIIYVINVYADVLYIDTIHIQNNFHVIYILYVCVCLYPCM